MPRIKSIDIKPNRVLIRYGKTELEIPGGKSALREWVRSRAATVDDETAIAMQIREHLKGGGTLEDLSPVINKDIDVATTAKEVANG